MGSITIQEKFTLPSKGLLYAEKFNPVVFVLLVVAFPPAFSFP